MTQRRDFVPHGDGREAGGARHGLGTVKEGNVPFCTNCGSDTGNVKFCPECGTPLTPTAGDAPGDSQSSAGTQASPGAGAAGGAPSQTIDPRMAGALSYFWPLAIVFLFAEPHKSVRFVRFHSFQSIFLAAGLAVLAIGIGIFSLVPLLGWIVGLFGFFLPLIWVGSAIFLGVKAYGGGEPHFPVIGDLADKQC